jgi:hypothetical protein
MISTKQKIFITRTAATLAEAIPDSASINASAMRA